MDKKEYVILTKTSNKTSYTAEDVIELLRIKELCDIVSLDKPLRGKDDDATESGIGDFVEDPSPSPQQLLEQESNKKLLLDIIHNVLSPREAKVIILRYGLGDEEPMTLETIGNCFGVTRERIRQIEFKAIRKLKWYIKVELKMKSEDF